MPRPTKMTPETTEKLVKALRLHATHRLACQYAGISEGAFYKYMKLGQADIEAGEATPFVEFVKAIKEAEGTASVAALAMIEKAASEGNWQAAAWKLERRYPREYGRRVHQIEGGDGGPVEVDLRFNAPKRPKADHEPDE